MQSKSPFVDPHTFAYAFHPHTNVYILSSSLICRDRRYLEPRSTAAAKLKLR